MKRSIAPALIASIVSFTPGCSMIMNGSYQDVSINTAPSGAAVTLDCGKGTLSSPVTPTIAKLQRKAPVCKATIAKSGYEEVKIAWLKHANYWWIADIPLFGVLCVITIPISIATGSTTSYDPEATVVTMAPKG